MRPTVLFFARDYQAQFFPLLRSEQYDSVFAVLNKKEKEIVINNGGKVVICLEEEFDNLALASYNGPYLKFSFGCDRNYIGLSLKEREIVLKKTITFWRSILSKYKPNLIVNETVAIEVAEVLAIEAERENIKYISWMSFPKKNTFYWQINPFHNSLERTLDHLVPTEENLTDARAFINGLREGLLKPFYISSNSSRYSFAKFLRNIWWIFREKSRSFFIPKVRNVVSYGNYISTYKWNIKLFILSVCSFSKGYDNLSDYSEKELVFYPLHYEPEAVLFYMAYFFDSQTAVIENILKCIGDHQVLVVKEHPQQPGALLENRFRKIKMRYPNLVYIRGEEKSSNILSKCKVVVSLGSTAGFEALALKKHVINLGLVFYDAYEGVNNCTSFDEVYDLMRGKTKFNSGGNFEEFVGKMLRYLKKGNPFPHAELYSQTNILDIRNAIEDELNNKNL